MPNEQPLVSILVLNWNGEKVIRRSLDSVRKLEYPNKEKIVVDNNSTDGSIEIIRNEFPDFQLLRNDKNLGFAAGMNIGIKKSKGDLLLLFNNDAVAHPRSLSILVERAMSNYSIGLVGGLILFYKPSNVIWSLGGMFDPLTGTIWSEGLGQILSSKVRNSKAFFNVDYLSGCVLLLKRDVIGRIGLFDEGFFLNGDDLDFCLRARRAGYECVLDPSALIWHIGSHSLRQLPFQSYVEREKSDFRIILIHTPIPFLSCALLFQLVVMPFIESLAFRLENVSTKARWGARIFAFSENLKMLGNILRTRKQIRKLGTLRTRVRILGLLGLGSTRIKSGEFFMGKLLKKE
jgi:GT2 family glycosyltransferase